MRKNRLREVKQDRLMEDFVADTTTRCAADLVGVNLNISAYYHQRLRSLIAYQMAQDVSKIFEGEIVVDESYFGVTTSAIVDVGQGENFRCFAFSSAVDVSMSRLFLMH